MKRLAYKILGPIVLLITLFSWGCGTGAEGAVPGIKGGKFEVTCKYVASNQVDPIVSPGADLSAHLHDFFGNTGVTKDSTPASLIGGATSCVVKDDTAGYWVPAAYRSDTGAQVKPTKIFAYYFGDPAGIVEHFPAGLELVAGDSHATAEATSKIATSFSCGNGGNTSPVLTHPYDCTPYSQNQGVVAIIAFPYCWDGTGLATADVAYGDSKGICPASFPHRLPQLQEHIHYGYGHADSRNFERGDLLTLASGPYYTEHADWMQAWNQTRLNSLVDTCLVIHKDCGFLTS